jgi:beta-galactosidase beta subunit
MQRFLFEYIYDNTQHIIINKIITSSLEEAIDWVPQHYLELHREGETDISAVRLRTPDDQVVLAYEMHLDAVRNP